MIPFKEGLPPGRGRSRGSRGGRTPRGRGVGRLNMPPFIMDPAYNTADAKADSSASSSKGESPSIPSPAKPRREPADAADYYSSGKNYATTSEAVKDPIQTPCFQKAKDQIIISLQKSDERLFTSPYALAERYFEHEAYFPADAPYKTQKYYEHILIETQSIKFWHQNINKFDVTDIAFSKAFIHKVLTYSDWGLNPNRPQTLKVLGFDYTYWDYIKAFSNVFYYQNPAYKHTWFIRLEPSMAQQNPPYWFYQWFDYFGPEPNYFPKKLLEAYDSYIIENPRYREKSIIGSTFARFLVKYYLPWIFQWTYSVKQNDLNIPTLNRLYHYKWWSKFEIPETLRKIEAAIEEFKRQAAEYAPKETPAPKHFEIPTLEELKNMFPRDSLAELKKKLFSYMEAQFNEKAADLFEGSSTKSSNTPMEDNEPHDPTLNIGSDNEEEDYDQANEDMEDHLLFWSKNKGPGPSQAQSSADPKGKGPAV